MVSVAKQVRNTRATQEITFELSTRNLIDWACWASEVPIKEAAEFAILNKVDPIERKKISDIINKEFREGEMWTPTGVLVEK